MQQMHARPSQKPAPRTDRTTLILPALVAALTLVACTGTPVAAQEVQPAKQPHAASRALRIMTLNMAHGRGIAFHQAFLSAETIEHNLAAIGAVVRREAPDVVALQEADGPSVWSGDFDHVALLARDAGMPNHFRGTQTDGFWPVRLDYGTSLLARLPLLSPRSERFDACWRDTKGFVVATVKVPAFGGKEVDIVSVHLDFLNKEVRAHQLAELEQALVGRNRPVIILGDMNCGLDEPTCISSLIADENLEFWDGGQATFPSDHPERRIDWVLVSKSLAFSSYRTLTDPLSDHRGVVAEIRLAAEPAQTAVQDDATPRVDSELPAPAAAQPDDANHLPLTNRSASTN